MHMRIIYLAGLVILSFGGYAQEFYLLKDPGSNPILLDKGWKYRMGDDPAFASNSYDDREWKTINPTMDVHDSSSHEAVKGIGWLRLHFKLQSKTINNTLALIVHQSVASEIFLNGRKIATYGVIDQEQSQVKEFDPIWKPIALSFSNDSIQTLAIRYAIKPGTKYTTIFEFTNPLVAVIVMQNALAIELYRNMYMNDSIFLALNGGILIMIFIVHFAFYLMYPVQKANLYLFLFGLVYLIGDTLQGPAYYYNHIPGSKYIMGNLIFLTFMLGNMMIFLSIHHFLKRKRDVFFNATMIYFLLCIFLNAFIYRDGWLFGGATFQIFTLFNIVRISLLSLKEKKAGAKIFLAGAIISLVAFVLFASMGTFKSNIDLLRIFATERFILYLIFTLGIPTGTSIYLAREFALTSRSLQKKLEEVEELSARNLHTEKEKQEILASQNMMLEQRVKDRTEALEKSLSNLRSAQAQLVQSEKMASLGELTAGIAHEIQNPLNFVNNFSELNKELVDDLQQELKAGKIDNAFAISNDIKDNEDKINHHGKRADAIVKGMLQHAKSNAGQKELTDINALANEYLRLAYHGLKAKDKSFSAIMKTEFDPQIGSINIVPQDIGRVLLNLYNNAFYAVSAKAKEHSITKNDRIATADAVNEKQKEASPAYEPTVWLQTKRAGDKVEISVRDNGNGIPDKIKEKIFQPFFTTKPTGQGTGLGLSLSYDIVKSHGGELKVESKEGEGSEFIIQLPANTL
jgi:two-component system, NtrC family, sensor kinase